MENVKRLTTAFLGLPLVGIILIFGNKYIVDIAFAVIAAISVHEYFNSMKGVSKPVIWLGYVVSASIAFIHLIPKDQVINVITLAIPLIMLALFLQTIISKLKTNIEDISMTFFGICYVTIFIMFIPLIYGLENGKFLVWYLLCAGWGSDVFAYFIGRYFGKHKFSKISPNKTVEGCIAGVVGSMIFATIFTFIFNMFFERFFSYAVILPFVGILSILGQIGDFAASSIKRYVGIKDFSNLIPGHGGMLDRIDSIIFIAPFAYFILKIMLG